MSLIKTVELPSFALVWTTLQLGPWYLFFTQEGVRTCDHTTKAWDRKKTLITFQDNLHCIFHYFTMQIVLTSHHHCSRQPNVV